MSVTGICQLCESAEARHACDRCGRVVCDEHFDRESGLCIDCARDVSRSEREERERRREREGRGGSPDDWGEPR